MASTRARAVTWDLAAPALILGEVGERLTDFSGRPAYDGPEALASDGLLHAALVDRLRT